jgi:hypothetical protein
LKNSRFFLGLFWMLHATLPAFAQTPEHALDKADSLFKQYNLAASHQAYTGIAADSACPKTIRTKACHAIDQLPIPFIPPFHKIFGKPCNLFTFPG